MKYIIYKIQIKEYIYIGSTMNFTIRKASHKRNCICESQKGYNLLLYKTIRENGGWDCCSMVPIKEIEVESKRHAEMVEEAVRVEYNAQMNTNRAYLTEDERKEYKRQWERQRNQNDERKEYLKQYNKQWRLAKKSKLAESPEIIVGG